MGDMFLLYLLTRLDGIHFVCGVTIFVFLMVSVFMLVAAPWGEENDVVKTFVIPYLYIPITAVVFLVLVPSKEDAIFILAGSNIMEIAKSDDTKRIAGKSVEIFEKYLNEMLKEEKSDGNAR